MSYDDIFTKQKEREKFLKEMTRDSKETDKQSKSLFARFFSKKNYYESVPLNEKLLNNASIYIKNNYGSKYKTVEEKEKEEQIEYQKRLQEEQERKKRREEVRNRKKEIDKAPTDKSNSSSKPVVDTGIKYSIPDDCDREVLSNQAHDYMSDILGGQYYRPFERALSINSKLETFRDVLINYIKRSLLDNTQVYKRANISRSVFSAIISDPNHIPKKNMVIALAIALRLNLKDTENLLMKAGYTFSNSIVTDLVAVYCINQKKYDIDEINRILYELNQPLLGSKM